MSHARWWSLGLLISLLPLAVNAACVGVRQAKLRTEPSRRAKVSWVVGRYMPLIPLESRGAWVKVRDLDGETHWIEGSELTSRYQCVVVRVGGTIARSSPSARSSKSELGLIEKYTALKRIDEDEEDEVGLLEGWYHVVDETGQEGWVVQDHIWRPASVMSLGF